MALVSAFPRRDVGSRGQVMGRQFGLAFDEIGTSWQRGIVNLADRGRLFPAPLG